MEHSEGTAPSEAGLAPSPRPARLSKQEKKAQRKLQQIEKKRVWRERQKQSAAAKVAERAAARAAELAAMDDAAREAYLAEEKARRDKMYHEKVAQSNRVDEALTSGLKVVLDLSYGSKMSSKEQISLARQLSRCWSVNRRASAPASLHLTGLGTCPPGCLPPNGDVERWKVRRVAEDVADAFPRESLVFLSPDAEEPLTVIDPHCVYIIGGLVDSSVQKCTSLQKAQALGARACRLPIAEHAPEAASKRLPLTLIAVLEIILAINAGADWPTALKEAVAPRLLRSRTWENSRAARRAESRARAARSWGIEPRQLPGAGGSHGDASADLGEGLPKDGEEGSEGEEDPEAGSEGSEDDFDFEDEEEEDDEDGEADGKESTNAQ